LTTAWNLSWSKTDSFRAKYSNKLITTAAESRKANPCEEDPELVELMESHRVLVTGCSGFLGRYVVQHLTLAGHEVVGFDLLEPKYPIDNFFKGDLTDKADLERVLDKASVVCHLGGIGDVYLAEKNPALAFRANALGSKVLADVCAERQIEKLVYASTWEVYGKSNQNPIDETHPCNPKTTYSISKLAGELFIRGADGLGGMRAIVLRLGTAYGPLMRESTVISRFIRRGIEHKPLTILGDGTQFRQFTHADDIARGFELVVSSSAPSQVYNMLSDEAITLFDLATQIARHFGTTIDQGSPRLSEPPSVHVRVDKAWTEFGWRSSVRFADGLQALIDAPEEVGAKRVVSSG